MLKIATAVAAVGLLTIAVTSAARADVGGNALEVNSLAPNILVPNTLAPNALTGNVLSANAIVPNALTGNVLSGNIISLNTLVSGAQGIDGRLLVIELPTTR